MTIDIKVKDDLDHIRTRPTMYVSNVNHATKEAIDNVIDEFQAGACSYLGIALDTESNQVTVADNGRGIPVDKNKDLNLSTFAVVFTKLHSSGKYENRDSNKYGMTIGLNGVGVKVTAATSSVFEAWTTKNNKSYYLTVQRGVLVRHKKEAVEGIIEDDLPKTPFKEKKLSTILRYTPDTTVFKTGHKIDAVYLEELCYSLKYLCPGLKIELVLDGKSTVYESKEGITGLIEERCVKDGEDSSECDAFHLDNDKIDLCLWWNLQTDGETILSYVNCHHTRDGGTHVLGLKKAVSAAFGEKGKNLSHHLREGLRCAFHIKIADPEFQGQHKHKLENKEASDVVEGAVADALEKWLNKNKELRDQILEKAVALKKAQDSYKQNKDALKHLGKTKAKTLCLPHKLISAPDCTPQQRELYICEGDSAAGPLIRGRPTPLTQEIYKLKGKITNAAKADIGPLLANEDVNGIIKSIGCGILDDCDPKKARVGKIIFIPDADADGSHINALLIALFVPYMTPLFDAGMIYMLRSPLFMADYREQHWYGKGINDQEAKKNLLSKVPANLHGKININRFKGHGAANPEEIYEYALGPNRELLQLTRSSTTEEQVEKLMGEDGTSRKELLGIDW